MFDLQLESTARALIAPGKGILAADESTSTISKRFMNIGVEANEENRRAYRELLFTTPGLHQFISGIILYDESIRHLSSDGTPLVNVLKQQGIIPGIKVDKGTADMAGFPGDKVTVGLDDLRERLAEYRELGARFTKWRAVIAIGSDTPSDCCLRANAHSLARFAALSQEAGLVPIVEPEVLMDGTHTIQRHAVITQKALRFVFEALVEHRVRLEGMLLKPKMVLAGKECPHQADAAEVADETLRCMRRTVPAAVPGLVFLSGGQRDVDATAHLKTMNQRHTAPWELSFSFGRALQDSALKSWDGNSSNITQAQRALHDRAQCNSEARSNSIQIGKQ